MSTAYGAARGHNMDSKYNISIHSQETIKNTPSIKATSKQRLHTNQEWIMAFFMAIVDKHTEKRKASGEANDTTSTTISTSKKSKMGANRK